MGSIREICKNDWSWTFCDVQCNGIHSVQMSTLLLYTVTVVKNMLKAQAQADQNDIGSG